MLYQPPIMDENFQKIVDEAKKLIPHYCPEWTDHNVSDPGVALIELFAWMTDMLIYRVNQVPDRMYQKFLDMIGRRLEPAHAATVPVTFYMSAPVTDPNGTRISYRQIATERTQTQEPILFTTMEEVDLVPPQLLALYSQKPDKTWQRRSVEQLKQREELGFFLFVDPTSRTSRTLEEGEFYLELQNDCSQFVLRVEVDNIHAMGIGSDPRDPPLQWEALAGSSQWEKCIVEEDTTLGFNKEGSQFIQMRLPASMTKTDKLPTGPAFQEQQKSFWLRCRVIKNRNPFTGSPKIRSMQVFSVGITVPAEHAVIVKNERLGFSDGTAGQIFPLRYSPILPLNQSRIPIETSGPVPNPLDKDTKKQILATKAIRDRAAAEKLQKEELQRERPQAQPPEQIVVRPLHGGKEEEERWELVQDFTNSHKDSRHFVIDEIKGTVTFGPTLLQPNGKMDCFGKIPPKGHEIVMERYRYGGGIIGNVAAKAICVLKDNEGNVARVEGTVARVTNWEAADGGLNIETLDSARFRVPEYLRKPTQAVTLRDYEAIACLHPEVAHARCLGPGQAGSGLKIRLSGEEREVKPGSVFVLLVQQEKDPNRRIERVEVATEVTKAVAASLQDKSMVGVQVEVDQAEGVQVQIEADVVSSRSNQQEIQDKAIKLLNAYLNPCIGGPEGRGWPFGKALYPSEILGLLQSIPEIAYVRSVSMYVLNSDRNNPGKQVKDYIVLEPYEVLCSGSHSIRVTAEGR